VQKKKEAVGTWGGSSNQPIQRDWPKGDVREYPKGRRVAAAAQATEKKKLSQKMPGEVVINEERQNEKIPKAPQKQGPAP